MASALSADKAIDLAAKQWADQMREALRTGRRIRAQLDAIVENRIIQYIDAPVTPRLVSMAS